MCCVHVREEEIYMNKLTEVNTHEQVFSQLWTECQHCQVRKQQEEEEEEEAAEECAVLYLYAL